MNGFLRQNAAPLAVSAGVGLVFGLILFAPWQAHADLNVETTLPADGVTSIEQTAPGEWTASFDAAPFEFKVISNPQLIVCGVNYGNLCGTTESFKWTAPDLNACIYTQVDWNGQHTSSDPYVCRPIGAPSSTPTPTPTPVPTSSTPSATPTPLPSPSATAGLPSGPSSAPTPSSTPVRKLGAAVSRKASSAPPELARTGVSKLGTAIGIGIFALLLIAGLSLTFLPGLRRAPRYKRGRA